MLDLKRGVASVNGLEVAVRVLSATGIGVAIKLGAPDVGVVWLASLVATSFFLSLLMTVLWRSAQR